MKVNVSLTVGEETVKHDIIEIEDWKLAELSQDEIEATIEVLIRTWAEQHVHIAWEVQDEERAFMDDNDAVED